MVKDLKEIYESLEEMSRELDAELSAVSTESDKFHEQLIDLISKYPESKEIIQFIVSINDKLVTHHTLSRDILYDATKGIISQKQYLIKQLIKDYEDKENKTSMMDKINNFIEKNKFTLILIGGTILVVIVVVLLIFMPKEIIEIIKLIKG